MQAYKSGLEHIHKNEFDKAEVELKKALKSIKQDGQELSLTYIQVLNRLAYVNMR